MVEFCARTANNDFDDFVSFFSKRDVEVRNLNTLVTGRAAAAGHHSAPNADEINNRIDDKANTVMANFAVAFEAAMDVGALDSGATASLVASKETAANVVDKLTSSSSSTHDAILATLKTISDRLEKVEKGGGGRRRNGADKEVSTKAADDDRKPCVNYGKRHKLPNKKCWVLDANKDDRPANYVKPPPGFAKGN